jgi:hypothetical protein
MSAGCERAERIGPRLRRHAVLSVALWAASLVGGAWYLRRAQPAPMRALPWTHPDSIGLPLVALAIVVAGVLLAANVIAALVRRRRR